MTTLVQSATDLLSFAVVVLDAFAVVLFFILIMPLRKRGWTKDLAEWIGGRAVALSFLVALAATAGSLFYSSVANFAPCLLCWWQRIFLFSQTILLFVALVKYDPLARLHAIIFSGLGALVSMYHAFLQFGGESILPCSASGASCEHVYFVEYGYVTIPTMALTAFVLILLFMLAPSEPRTMSQEP